MAANYLTREILLRVRFQTRLRILVRTSLPESVAEGDLASSEARYRAVVVGGALSSAVAGEAWSHLKAWWSPLISYQGKGGVRE